MSGPLKIMSVEAQQTQEKYGLFPSLAEALYVHLKFHGRNYVTKSCEKWLMDAVVLSKTGKPTTTLRKVLESVEKRPDLFTKRFAKKRTWERIFYVNDPK